MSDMIEQYLRENGIYTDDNLRGHTAGFITRLLAFLIDLAIVTVISTATAATFVVLLGLINIDVSDCSSSEIGGFSLEWLCYGFLVIAPFVQGTFVFLYHFFFWWLTGRTPGKSIMGIKILPLTGDRHMTPMRTIRRIVGYVVSLLALGLGFGWILVDDQRQSWADKFANTVVIYNWDARLYDGIWLGQEREDLLSQKQSQTWIEGANPESINQEDE